MIKINLLPSYVHEARRIKMTIAIFVALFIIEGGIVFGWQSGLQKQADWYVQDQQRCEAGKVALDKYAADATALQAEVGTYDEWINTFADLQPFKDYNEKLAQSMIEVGAKLGGKRAWFTQITIQPDGAVQATGKIKGSMNFLSYYFSLKDEGFDLAPAVQPYDPSSKISPEKQMAQEIAVDAQGKVTPLPPVPTLPNGSSPYNGIYQPVSGGAASGGAANGGTMQMNVTMNGVSQNVPVNVTTAPGVTVTPQGGK